MRILTATFFMLLLITGGIGKVLAQTAPVFNIRVGPVSFDCENESTEISISLLRLGFLSSLGLDGDTLVEYDLVAYNSKGKQVFSSPVEFPLNGTGYAVISATDCSEIEHSAKLYVDGILVTEGPAEGVVVAYRTRLNLGFKYHNVNDGSGRVGQDIAATYYANENSFPPFIGAITTISKDGSTRGTVKWFNESKGYGFITRDGGEDSF